MPSTTDPLSTGTVILPISKHIDYFLSQSDRTSRSDGIREKAKNKVCQSSCAKCHQSILNWAPSSARGRIASISASPIPIGPAVRTLFAKRLKIRSVPSACAKCHRSILDRHRHLPVVETHRIVPLPFRSDQRFGRYSRKGKQFSPFGTRYMARSNPWPTTDFKLGQPACDLQVWDQCSPPFDL